MVRICALYPYFIGSCEYSVLYGRFYALRTEKNYI